MHPYDIEPLALSGLQHYAFCKRQWALIHLESQWEDNLHTVLGDILHEKAHGGLRAERRGELLIIRHLDVRSESLGLRGVCDVVEFVQDPAGVPIHGWEGRWRPMPVEYKKGRGASLEADSLQLCAQAMCLEEMLCCAIPEACIYYGEPRRRSAVALEEGLRQRVRDCVKGMRALFERQHTPPPVWKKACRSCSLSGLCLPQLGDGSAAYIRAALED